MGVVKSYLLYRIHVTPTRTESEWVRLQRLRFHVDCSFGERCLTRFAPFLWKCWLKRTKRRSETEAPLPALPEPSYTNTAEVFCRFTQWVTLQAAHHKFQAAHVSQMIFTVQIFAVCKAHRCKNCTQSWVNRRSSTGTTAYFWFYLLENVILKETFSSLTTNSTLGIT